MSDSRIKDAFREPKKTFYGEPFCGCALLLVFLKGDLSMRSIMVFSGFLAWIMPACVPGALAQGQPVGQKMMKEDCVQAAGLLEKLKEAEAQLQDWPNLAHYREANAKLAPAAREKRVVFLGDSITEMWAEPRSGGFFPGKPYVDRGIGGQTTPQMLIRFRPDVIALKPKAVVILAGTNDLSGNIGPMSLGEIEGNLASMAALARSSGIRVVLASVLPVSNYGHDDEGHPIDRRISRPPEKILELNAWIKKYAAEKGHLYLDYFSVTVDERGLLKKELSEDGLHPNAAGFAAMAPLAERAIQSALKKQS
jgi:lysophospholipase L1-like esterase